MCLFKKWHIKKRQIAGPRLTQGWKVRRGKKGKRKENTTRTVYL